MASAARSVSSSLRASVAATRGGPSYARRPGSVSSRAAGNTASTRLHPCTRGETEGVGARRHRPVLHILFKLALAPTPLE